jgi:hypothetical protein
MNLLNLMIQKIIIIGDMKNAKNAIKLEAIIA